MKGYGSLPRRFDLVCATCGCKSAVDNKQSYGEFSSTCQDLESPSFAAVQTFSNVLEGFKNASRFRDEIRSKDSLKKLATQEGNSHLGSNCRNSKDPEITY